MSGENGEPQIVLTPPPRDPPVDIALPEGPLAVPETVLHAPSHYTAQFDAEGRPQAVTADHPDALAALPAGWDDYYWDWQPRGDAAGAWVQRVDARRDALWALVKAAREAQLGQAMSTPHGPLQIDAASMDALRGRAQRLMMAEPPETVMWTMADDVPTEIAAAAFLAMVAVAEDEVDRIHLWSQDVRAALFDPAADSLEALAAIADGAGL